ncbi:GNAT family N-acetyltransferase [Cohnella pontilimi]|nr:GNAT family N-acetyltransferase [Cohnella pontilimi]
MLVDLKARLDEPAIRELFEYAMFADTDEDEVIEALDRYRKDQQLRAFGLESEGQIVAVIGYRRVEENKLDIKHLAVSPDQRGLGYGRGIILRTLELEKPQLVTVETDEEAVEFYRNIGFIIESLGEKYSGVERFKCTFETDF